MFLSIVQSEYSVNMSFTPLEQTVHIGENASFSCEAEITGREEIGIRIFLENESVEFVPQNGVKSCTHEENKLECMNVYFGFGVQLSCQYGDPYSIICDFWIHSITDSEVAMTAIQPAIEVECFVTDGFNDITSISANLSLRCKSWTSLSALLLLLLLF